MPSPFPGMDPYLERPGLWGGFHSNLYNRIQTALNRSLPPGYFADVDEYVWPEAEEPDDRRLLGKPDVFVTDRNGAAGGSHGPGGVGAAVAVAPSVETTLPKTRKKTRRYVKIVAPDHRTVATVVEVLSPSNKASGADRTKYLAEREEFLATGTSLVEIDLLRDGERMPLGKPSPPAADSYVFVCRGREYPKARVWAFTVREPIPPFAVPLLPAHPDLALALGPLVAEIYDTNRFAGRVDYTPPVAPAFRKPDAEWIADLLKAHAARATT